MLSPTLLQTKTLTTASNSTSTPITFDSPMTPGSVVIIGLFSSGTRLDFVGANDSFGNVYASIANPTSVPTGVTNTWFDVIYPLSPTPRAASNTVTIQFNHNSRPLVLVAREYGSLPITISWPAFDSSTFNFDSINTGTGLQLDSAIAGFTNHTGNNLMIAMAVNDGTQTMSANNNFGNIVNVTNGSYTFCMADLSQNVVTVPDASFTIPVSANWACALVDFYVDNPIGMVGANVVTAASTSASVVATFGAATTVGNMLVATVYADAAAPAISGWTQITNNNFRLLHNVAMYYKVADGTETTVTATATAATVMKLHVYEMNGTPTPVVIDGTPGTSASVSTGTTLESGALTTTNPRTFVLGTFATAGDLTPLNATTSTGTDIYMPVMSKDIRLLDVITFRAPSMQNPLLSGSTFTAAWGSTGFAGTILAAFDAAPPLADPLSGDIGTVGIGS